MAQTPEFVENLCLGSKFNCHTVTFLMKIIRAIEKEGSLNLCWPANSCVPPLSPGLPERGLPDVGRDWKRPQPRPDRSATDTLVSSVPAYTLLSFPSLCGFESRSVPLQSPISRALTAVSPGMWTLPGQSQDARPDHG